MRTKSPLPRIPPSLALGLALSLAMPAVAMALDLPDPAAAETTQAPGEAEVGADDSAEVPSGDAPGEDAGIEAIDDEAPEDLDRGLIDDGAVIDGETGIDGGGVDDEIPAEGDAVPDDEPALDEDLEDEEPRAVVQALEGSQEAVTRAVVGLSRRMDRMLGARETYPDEYYDSLLRLRFIQRIDDAGGSQLEPDLSGRVSLPGAEQRWAVIFLSDDFDDPLDRERRTDRELDEITRRSIALRYLQPLEEWQTSLSAGLRSGEPIDLLTRGRVWRDFQAGRWGIRPSQSVFWYDERGLGASTEVRIEHPLRLLLLARSDSGATWFKRDERFYYDQIFSLLQPLSRRRGLLWQAGVQAESEPRHHVTRYYAQVRWRSIVYRDWVIVELRPQLIRERENDFHLERRIYAGIEFLFGDPFRRSE